MAEEHVQRRLAANLAADMVGYSRPMGVDEEGTLARLNAVRGELLHPKIAEYGGRIVKTTGDGTLVEFPSAVDAVQHAADVQHAVAILPDRAVELAARIIEAACLGAALAPFSDFRMESASGSDGSMDTQPARTAAVKTTATVFLARNK